MKFSTSVLKTRTMQSLELVGWEEKGPHQSKRELRNIITGNVYSLDQMLVLIMTFGEKYFLKFKLRKPSEYS